MTIVEFFDKEAIENIVSSLLCNPDKVVFVGYTSNKVRSAIEEYSKITRKYGKSVRFSICPIKENTLQNIINALEKILAEDGEITIDLTGGGELYLVAAGIVHNRNPERVQLHRFNVYKEELTDCDADGNVLESLPGSLTIKENLAIHGGKVHYDAKSTVTTQEWDFTDGFTADINTMWNICREDAKVWNSTLNGISNDDDKTTHRLQKITSSIDEMQKILDKLKNAGLIYNVIFRNGKLTFDCKNEQIMRCLMKAGQVLELKTARILRYFDEKNEVKKLNDILSGVVINWNNFGMNRNKILNEVDVMAMKGLVPIFISCKNGDVEVEEFYKLNTIANRFGGKYAKKVLVATGKLNTIIHRAEELGIIVIDNVGEVDFNDEETKQKINSVFN